MKRHYFVTRDLDDLENVEEELASRGIDSPQVHVLSENDSEIKKHHLHDVVSVLRNDVFRSGMKGALIGLVLAGLVILVGYVAKAENSIEWLPFSFLAIIVFGFCTWEGGLFGFQESNSEFRRFSKTLAQGMHVLFVDIDEEQITDLQSVISHHPRLSPAGMGDAPPSWFVKSQKGWRSFIKTMP